MQGLNRTTTLCLTLFSTPLWADVHYVAPGQSIQAAVDAAADGDEIVLDSGLYVETVEVLLKNLSIRGVGSDSTVWEPAFGAMLESTFSNLIVEGIAFEHGSGASTAGSTRGGALFIQSSTIEIYDCSFYNNRSAGGGAVYLSNADAVVSGCRFDENYLTTGNTGGTTIFSNYATLDVYDSTFEENGWGGSGFAYGTVQVNNGYLFASNCYFNHNQSSATGFGLVNSSGVAGHCTFVDSVFHGNLIYDSSFKLLDSVFLSDQEPPVDNANRIFDSGSVEVAGCVLPTESEVLESTSTIPGALNVVRWAPEFEVVNGYLVPQIDSSIAAIAGSADSLYSPTTIVAPITDLHGELRDTPRSIGAIETTGAPAPTCPTDVDHNNRTDYMDLIAVLTHWGVADEPLSEDFNQDGFVDLNDLTTVLSNWGPCS